MAALRCASRPLHCDSTTEPAKCTAIYHKLSIYKLQDAMDYKPAALHLPFTSMFHILLFAFAAFAGTLQVQAVPAPWQHPSLGPSNAKCVRSTYIISSSSKNVKFKNVTASEEESDTTFVVSLQQRSIGMLNPVMCELWLNCDHSLLTETSDKARVFANEHEDGIVEVNQTFSISGTLCTPYNNKAPKTVQLLIHGCPYTKSTCEPC
jgi:hypothetical protein